MIEFDDDGMPVLTEVQKLQQDIEIKNEMLANKNDEIRNLKSDLDLNRRVTDKLQAKYEAYQELIMLAINNDTY